MCLCCIETKFQEQLHQLMMLPWQYLPHLQENEKETLHRTLHINLSIFPYLEVIMNFMKSLLQVYPRRPSQIL